MTADTLAENRQKIKADAQLIANGYEPVVVRGKAPVSKGWQAGEVTIERVAAEREAHPYATNTGLRTGRLVGIDIDIEHPSTVAAIKECARDVLGPTMFERIGQKGAMLCYRNETPIGKITIGGGDGGWPGKVEILGKGQQFVAYGTHPAGIEYRWPNDVTGWEPLEYPLTGLQEVTPDKLREFAARLAVLLKELGYGSPTVSDRGDDAKRTARAARRRQDKAPVPLEQLQEILGYIDPGCERGDWIGVIGGIQATNLCGVPEDEMDEHLREIAQAWSRADYQKGPPPANWVNDRDVEDVYWSLNPDKPGGTTFGTLYHQARENGYAKPAPGESVEARYGDAEWARNVALGWDVSKAGKPEEAAETLAAYIKRITANDPPGRRTPQQFGGWQTWGDDFLRREFPTHEWVWQDRLLAYEPNLYTGLPGAGKTTLAENIAVAVATGTPFLGYDVMPMPVMLLVAEDEYGAVRANIKAIAAAFGVSDKLEGRLHLLSVKSDPYDDGYRLATFDGARVTSTKFMTEVVIPKIREIGGPVLFIVDPLAEFATIDYYDKEASRAASRQLCAPLCNLNGGQVTVLVNDHPSKASQADGSHVAGDVQFAAGFSLTATLHGTKSEPRRFETIKPRYAASTSTPFHRDSQHPAAFVAGTEPAVQVAGRKRDVYRVIRAAFMKDPPVLYRRDGRGDLTLNGPEHIAMELGLVPSLDLSPALKEAVAKVRGAISSLIKDEWLEWVENGGGGRAGHIPAHLEPYKKRPTLEEMDNEF